MRHPAELHSRSQHLLRVSGWHSRSVSLPTHSDVSQANGVGQGIQARSQEKTKQALYSRLRHHSHLEATNGQCALTGQWSIVGGSVACRLAHDPGRFHK